MTGRLPVRTGFLCAAALLSGALVPRARGQCDGPCNTPTGSDVEVADPLSGIAVTFPQVTQAGETVFLPLAAASQGFQICRQANHFSRCDVFSTGTYYIQTSAEFSGDVRVCMPYSDTGLTRLDELRLELFEVAPCDDPRPGLCEQTSDLKWVKISCDGSPSCDGTPLGDATCRDWMGNRLCGLTSGESMRVPLHPSVELESAIQGMLSDLLLPSSSSAGIGNVILELEARSGAGIGQVSIEVVDAEGAPISSELIQPEANPITYHVSHIIPITRSTANGTATIRVIVQNSSFTESAEAVGYFNVAGNEPPTCHVNGPYAAECAGADTELEITGGESSDPEMDPLIYAWSTDCPGGVFDDSAAASPRLTVHAAAGCSVACDVTLVLSDGAKTDTCTSSVFIEDTTAPDLVCPDDATLEYPADTSTTATGLPTGTDACSNETLSHTDDSSATCGSAHTIHRTWQAADECEHTTTCVQIIAVQDTMPPTISCAADVTLEFPAITEPEATGAAAATDAGGEVMVGWTDDSSAGCGATSTITRTWQAVDECDNTSTCVQIITVVDTTPPEIACPADISLECPADTSEANTGSATATDAGGGSTITWSDTTTPGCGATSTITRTWQAVDECDNTATCVQIITVVDTTPPEIACPADISLECPADTSEANTGSATATDAGGGATITWSDTTTPGCGATSTITRTWQAVDECDNTSTCVQIITVVDTTPPEITCPTDVALECPADTSEASTGSATATDTGGAVTIARSDATTPGCGTTATIARTWTATDECGNSGTAVQSIVVYDNTPPVIHLNSTPIVVNNSDCSATEPVTLPPATATDSCDAHPTLTHNAPSPFPTGTTLVTYTARDACGNSSMATRQVTVKYGATIRVDLAVDFIGSGSRPHTTKQSLAGLDVCAYDIRRNNCAFERCQNNPWQTQRQCVANLCPEVNCGQTDARGKVSIDVPPGMYLLVAYPDSEHAELMQKMVGSRMTASVRCGETKEHHLRLMIKADHSRVCGRVTRRTGSELLVIEPEYVIWDEETQLYPFVFESLGEWDVVVSVEPPEGFVSDYQALDAEVTSEVEAVQFTVVEVGSDLVPTKTSFDVTHKGRRELIKSEVGIFLTEDYARSRGFDVATLRSQGLIREKEPRFSRRAYQLQNADPATNSTPATPHGGKSP